MNKNAKKFLFELLETPSPTTSEAAGQRIWRKRVEKFSDSVHSDVYGNTWAELKGSNNAPKVMLEAHADEIGFMIQHIADNGFLSIIPIGGSDRTIARGKRIQIFGDKGPVLGIIGNTAIHLRKDVATSTPPEWHELFVDIGASKRKEVEDRGIRVGHSAVYIDTVTELTPGRLAGRAIDNRIGGFILAQVLEELSSGTRPTATLLAVNAVQEEIGGAGARMVAYRLFPDLAIILDVTHATDSPGIEQTKYGQVKLGCGPTVTHGTANHPKLVERIIKVAKTEKIPLQHEASSHSSGTDADDVYPVREGIPCALISIPLRYMHSPVEVVDFKDVENCIKLLKALICSIKPNEHFKVEI